ncbi:MAG: type II toxin-antitoxin system RelE/ParE family toxin [Nitrosarchaeum sp.]|nr:type II toxin-antitoxin system RelE/ParE family toxin [Nitrosarchaeum sp.]
MMVDNIKNQVQTGIEAKHPQFEVNLTEYCEKKYLKLIKKDKILEKWTENYLEELQTNPYIGEKLEANFPGFRSIHYLGNKYRIVYKIIYEPIEKIVVFEIDHRKSSYSELAKAIGQGK